MIWETSEETYIKRKDLMESNTIAIYAIVWGQCNNDTVKLESLDVSEEEQRVRLHLAIERDRQHYTPFQKERGMCHIVERRMEHLLQTRAASTVVHDYKKSST
jgi:hypothetical protein